MEPGIADLTQAAGLREGCSLRVGLTQVGWLMVQDAALTMLHQTKRVETERRTKEAARMRQMMRVATEHRKILMQEQTAQTMQGQTMLAHLRLGMMRVKTDQQS